MQAYQQQVSEFFDNPANTDAEAEAQKPSNAAAGTPVGQYPVTYFRQRFGIDGEPHAHGPIECFVIDCISHRSPLPTPAGGVPDGDDEGLSMLGSVQLSWLKARLAASTATWKLIFSTKATYWPGTGGNADSWAFYTAERDEILGPRHELRGNEQAFVQLGGILLEVPRLTLIHRSAPRGWLCRSHGRRLVSFRRPIEGTSGR